MSKSVLIEKSNFHIRRNFFPLIILFIYQRIITKNENNKTTPLLPNKLLKVIVASLANITKCKHANSGAVFQVQKSDFSSVIHQLTKNSLAEILFFKWDEIFHLIKMKCGYIMLVRAHHINHSLTDGFVNQDITVLLILRNIIANTNNTYLAFFR